MSAEELNDTLPEQEQVQALDEQPQEPKPEQPQEAKPPKKGMSSGLKRLITGALLAGIMAVFLLVLRPIFVQAMDIIAMIFLVAGGLEMRRALKAGGHQVMLVPLIVFDVVVYPLFWFFHTEGIMLAFALASVVTLVIFTFKHTYSLHDAGFTVFTLAYPSVFVAMIMAVNLYAGNLLALFMMIVVPLASDACAYFVGSIFGKHKLCPTISPKKSVEGLFGGIAGALIAGAAFLLLFDVFHVFDKTPNVGLTHLSTHLWVSILLYALLSVLCMLSGMVGDLVASWIKRQVGIKDYGRIFPGHGGVMDRMDSVIFSMPAIYIFFVIYNAIAGALA